MSFGGPGFASKDPELLCPCIKRRLERLTERATSMGIKVTLLETMRDMERQEWYLKNKRSKTLQSKHLPQPPNSLALAFDLAPSSYLELRGWWPEGPLWKELGIAGESLGLTWGGPGLVKDGFNWDFPHYQLSVCLCERGWSPQDS